MVVGCSGMRELCVCHSQVLLTVNEKEPVKTKQTKMNHATSKLSIPMVEVQ